MKENFKITFLLPTCEPDEMFKWLLPSLKNIQLAKNYVNFAVCFQPPYTEEEINKVLDELNVLGFEYKYFYKDYKVVKPYTPLIKMRNDCAMLYPDSLVYGLLDDDMSFTSDKIVTILDQTLKLFIENKTLSVVSIRNPYMNVVNNCFATNLGLFFRGGISYDFKGLVPENLYQFNNISKLGLSYNNENLIQLFGGYQDKFCAAIRILNGGDAVIFWTDAVQHVENRKEKGAIAHGWQNAQYLDGSIAQFIIKYFCKDFLDSHSMKLFNQDIIKKLKETTQYKFITISDWPNQKNFNFFYSCYNEYKFRNIIINEE